MKNWMLHEDRSVIREDGTRECLNWMSRIYLTEDPMTQEELEELLLTEVETSLKPVTMRMDDLLYDMHCSCFGESGFDSNALKRYSDTVDRLAAYGYDMSEQRRTLVLYRGFKGE